MDRDWAKETQGDDPDHLVPDGWVWWQAPIAGSGGWDTGQGKYGFTRDWGTFFATVLFSTFYFFVFHLMKNEQTNLSKEAILKAMIIAYAYTGASYGLSKFGVIGFNPMLSLMSIIFKVSQTDGSASPYAHYLWVYIIAPTISAGLAGILHLIHVNASAKGGEPTSYD